MIDKVLEAAVTAFVDGSEPHQPETDVYLSSYPKANVAGAETERVKITPVKITWRLVAGAEVPISDPTAKKALRYVHVLIIKHNAERTSTTDLRSGIENSSFWKDLNNAQRAATRRWVVGRVIFSESEV